MGLAFKLPIEVHGSFIFRVHPVFLQAAKLVVESGNNRVRFGRMIAWGVLLHADLYPSLYHNSFLHNKSIISFVASYFESCNLSPISWIFHFSRNFQRF